MKPFCFSSKATYAPRTCLECGKPLQVHSATHVRHKDCARKHIKTLKRTGTWKPPSQREYQIRPMHGPKSHAYMQAADRVEAELARGIPWETVFMRLEARSGQRFRAMCEWLATERRRTLAQGGHSKFCRCALCHLKAHRGR